MMRAIRMLRLPLPDSREWTSASQRRNQYYATVLCHAAKPCVREQLLLTMLCRAFKRGGSRKQSAVSEAVRVRAVYAHGRMSYSKVRWKQQAVNNGRSRAGASSFSLL
eukprot:6251497-Heterocapsa_arctica.AAC.1